MSRKKDFFSGNKKAFEGVEENSSQRGNSRPRDLLLPGRKAISDMLATRPEQIVSVMLNKDGGPGIKAMLELCRQAGVRFSLVPAAALDRLYQGAHQGALAKVFPAGFTDLAGLLNRAAGARLPILLALDQIKDPGNLGTLARSVLAMGGGGIIVPGHNSACLGPAAAKASAGALAELPVSRVVNLGRALDQAREDGFFIYAAESGGDNVFTAKLIMPAILVLGAEKSGLRPGVSARCQAKLGIPMPGPMESLNLAQAGAIIIGQFARLCNQSLK